jgi:glycosyltransferase involved in cell wall biosynthesis
MANKNVKVICYLAFTSGDWGGASRSLFTSIRLLDRTRYEPLMLLPSEGPILPLLKEMGVRYVIWGKTREPRGLFNYVRDILAAAWFFKRNRVALLHLNHAEYWRPAEVIAAKLLGIPIVTHYRLVIRKPSPFIRHSSLIVAVSQFTADNSESRGVPKLAVHNSVNLKRFDEASNLRAELGLSPDDVVVSFLGQIRTIKGIDLFIRMAHQIPGKAVKFLIAGDCRNPEKFEGAYTEEKLRAEMGNDPRIQYVGYRPDVQHLYRTSDIIVMPSRWGEPFGLINIEAGAAGKPIISTKDGGIPEIIRHGENGFLIDRDDLAALIHYTKLLVEDPALRWRMGQTARRIVEERFTTLPVRRLEQAYLELIG